MKAVLALLLSLCATEALAATCTTPSPTVGFSQSFYGPDRVNGFVYNQTTAGLYVTWRTRQYTLYLGVPVGVAQAFTRTQTPDAYVANTVYPVYRQALEAENCTPLLAESGSILQSQHRP